MTTLDDAAERRIAELARHIRWVYTHPTAADEDSAIYSAVRNIWSEASEAAALKCDAVADEVNSTGESTYVADRCAAAIRGKG